MSVVGLTPPTYGRPLTVPNRAVRLRHGRTWPSRKPARPRGTHDGRRTRAVLRAVRRALRGGARLRLAPQRRPHRPGGHGRDLPGRLAPARPRARPRTAV